MKKLALLFAAVLTLPSLILAAKNPSSSDDVYVSGHYKSNGTYVEPYYRSAPNAYKWDNYGYQPSQPQNNPSFQTPTKNYNSNWYQPNTGRLNDNNPFNNAPTYQSGQ